jgi:hypothetical protein
MHEGQEFGRSNRIKFKSETRASSRPDALAAQSHLKVTASEYSVNKIYTFVPILAWCLGRKCVSLSDP